MAKKKQAPSREGMIVFSVALPAKLHRRLAIKGLDERIAMAEMVRRAITEYLDRNRKGEDR